MSQFVPLTTLGIRTVDVNGNVIRGPLYLQNNPTNARRQPGGYMAGLITPTAGLTLGSANVAYVPDLIGPVTMADWQKVPILNGYRVMLELDFAEVIFDNSQASGYYGYGLLLNFFADSLRPAPTWAPLQMNLYAGTGTNLWRGMYPTTPWKPVWLSGKQNTMAMAIKLTFESRALLTDITALNNDLGAYEW